MSINGYRRLAMAIGVATLVGVFGAGQASAQPVEGWERGDHGWHEGWRRHEWREHEWREREWEERHAYVPPPVVVAPPPPAVYYPPPVVTAPPAGITLVLPLNFR